MKGRSIILVREGKDVGEKGDIIKPRPTMLTEISVTWWLEEDSNTNILKL